MSSKQKNSPFNLSLVPMESSLGYVRLDVIIARAHTHAPAKHSRTRLISFLTLLLSLLPALFSSGLLRINPLIAL